MKVVFLVVVFYQPGEYIVQEYQLHGWAILEIFTPNKPVANNYK